MYTAGYIYGLLAGVVMGITITIIMCLSHRKNKQKKESEVYKVTLSYFNMETKCDIFESILIMNVNPKENAIELLRGFYNNMTKIANLKIHKICIWDKEIHSFVTVYGKNSNLGRK